MLAGNHSDLWERLYQSPWQHPGVAFFGGAVLTLCALLPRRRGPGVKGRRWALLFLILQIEILLDAALTGALSPVASGSTAALAVGTLFVVLGDLRYFYLFERQLARPQERPWSALRVALPLSLLLPTATGIAARLFPERLSGNRLFLGYEVGFLLLASLHLWLRRLGHTMTIRRRAYALRLFFFELVQYALWVLADVLIVTGHDLGWALRIAPNLLYYAAFVPVAISTAPPEAQP